MTTSDYEEIKRQTHKNQTNKNPRNICGEVQGVTKGDVKQEEKQVGQQLQSQVSITILTEDSYLSPVHSTTTNPSISTCEVLLPQYI